MGTETEQELLLWAMGNTKKISGTTYRTTEGVFEDKLKKCTQEVSVDQHLEDEAGASA